MNFTMAIWTYLRPFKLDNDDYEVKFQYTLTEYTSKLYCNGELVDEITHSFNSGLIVIEHTYPQGNNSSPLMISVGYYSWWSIGIEVKQNDELLYSSHPNKDIYCMEAKMAKLTKSENAYKPSETVQQEQKQKWQKNKYSIFADIVLGLAFYIVAKVTDDLTVAAFTGVTLGLALVVVQRFVKVDLLGGFAMFGTIMLLISAVLSLSFQSEYFVQIKGTIMGILSASVLLVDGVFREGRYFGPRFERFLYSPVQHQYFVLGLALIGLVMAAINYCAATFLSKDDWLTYTTFLDMPLYFLMFFVLIHKAGKRVQ